MILNKRSEDNLVGVHPDLVKVVHLAAANTNTPFIITEGLRSLDRQKQLVAAGASKTMRSRHLDGHAIDVAAYLDLDGDGVKDPEEAIRWDWPLYAKIAVTMKDAALRLGIPLEWGGDWKTFKDGPHFQLPWERYPAND